MGLDVETDSAAVGQLRVTTQAHQFAGMRIRLAFEEELGDPMLERIDFGAFGIGGWGRKPRQLSYIALDPLGKLDLELGGRSGVHDLANLNADFS